MTVAPFSRALMILFAHSPMSFACRSASLASVDSGGTRICSTVLKLLRVDKENALTRSSGSGSGYRGIGNWRAIILRELYLAAHRRLDNPELLYPRRRRGGGCVSIHQSCPNRCLLRRSPQRLPGRQPPSCFQSQRNRPQTRAAFPLEFCFLAEFVR